MNERYVERYVSKIPRVTLGIFISCLTHKLLYYSYMLKIYITRHGQNVDNLNGILNGHRDEPLTEKGVEQAHAVADKIKEAHIGFDAVYSSPLARAFDTAKIISDTVGLPQPRTEDLLIERDFGVMTGQKIADIESLCAPDILKTDTITYFLSPEGAETFPDMMQRSQVLLDKIKSQHPTGNVLLVCHGDIGKMIYAQYYGLDWQTVLTRFHFGNCDLLLLAEDSPADETHVFKFEQHNH
jgi:broad specificity phosphatase PhoE